MSVEAAGTLIDEQSAIMLFLCGDVMTGRGIDQILVRPSRPTLHEPHVHDATDYVRLAEAANGDIPRGVEAGYIWGAALDELNQTNPDLRLVNLETAITDSNDYDRAKSIHYRMHPANVACLTDAGIDCCGLANNHVLDWGRKGLQETLDTLAQAGIAVAGAGATLIEAISPAVFPVSEQGRVLVFACGSESSGIPAGWAASERRSGVWLIDEETDEAVDEVAERVAAVKRRGDVAILSIHWGDNWGYHIPAERRSFAHDVIDRAGIDVVHGHSSHHFQGMEVYRGRLILYGCGDLLTDYEGIGGREEYRPDLGLMYFVWLNPATGELLRVEMTPMQLRRFQLVHPSVSDVDWVARTLDRECRRLGTSIELQPGGRMSLNWCR